MPDSFFGGKDDLTAALGYEEDGVTTIVFRKKLEGEAREKSSTRHLKLDFYFMAPDFLSLGPLNFG